MTMTICVGGDAENITGRESTEKLMILFDHFSYLSSTKTEHVVHDIKFINDVSICH